MKNNLFVFFPLLFFLYNFLFVLFFRPDGACATGYGGKPMRNCSEPENPNQSNGVFGNIVNPCIKRKSFFRPNSHRNIVNKIPSVPRPLAMPPMADIYSSTAILSWAPASDCFLFNAYVLAGDVQVPLNNGEGLLLTTPAITALNVCDPL